MGRLLVITVLAAAAISLPAAATGKSAATSLVGVSVIEGTTANLTRDNSDAERVQGVRVNANWFTLLRIAPLAGRFFAEGEDPCPRATRDSQVIAEVPDGPSAAAPSDG